MRNSIKCGQKVVKTQFQAKNKPSSERPDEGLNVGILTF